MREVRMIDYGNRDDVHDASGDEAKILEWEIGLPSGDDLTPLSQSLVPPVLAVAFSVTSERNRTIQDVNRASQNTLSSLCTCNRSNNNSDNFKTGIAVEEIERVGSSSPGSDRNKSGGGGGGTGAVDPIAEEGDSVTNDLTEKTLKRPRLVWTPQLHKRFLQVVTHLGIKNAVPKTIMQLMNVDGLTRENVASHLQKYRLYLKRIQRSTMEEDLFC